MSDETPGGPIRETPAPDDALPPGMPRRYQTHAPRLERDRSSAGAVGKGIMAAIELAAALVMIDIAAVVAVLLVVDWGESMKVATWVSLLLMAAGVGAGLVVSRRLPPAARASFWAMGTVFAAFALIFLGAFCGGDVSQIGG
jgi:hypothetical protein